MNAYVCQEKDGDWAMLVFAPTARRARQISYGVGCHEPDHYDDWVRWQARRIWKPPETLSVLDDGTEQVIDNPPTCDNCNCWGGEPREFGCSFCQDDEDETP